MAGWMMCVYVAGNQVVFVCLPATWSMAWPCLSPHSSIQHDGQRPFVRDTFARSMGTSQCGRRRLRSHQRKRNV